MEPSFIIAGATQSGMEILRDLLGSNTAVFLPKSASAFFAKNQRYQKGVEWYKSLFRKSGTHQTSGEICPAYFEHGIIFDEQGQYLWSEKDDSALRIKKQFPQMKIILALRNPLERAELQYQSAFNSTRERTQSFEAALQDEKNGGRHKESSPFCYLYRNAYSVHVGHWYKLFGRNQVYICLYDDLVSDPTKVLNQIEQFIGVRPRQFGTKDLPRLKKPRASSGSAYGKLKAHYPVLQLAENKILNWPPLKTYLEKRRNVDAQNPHLDMQAERESERQAFLAPYFRDDVEALQTLLGRDDLLKLWNLDNP